MSPALSAKRVAKVALLGTFPPRRCGIATFTSDLASALVDADPGLEVDAVAMSDQHYLYSPKVTDEIDEDDPSAYGSTAEALNVRAYDVLSVQHEFGIYGGDAGGYLLNLVRASRMPVVTTLHTVLHSPTLPQRHVLQELVQLSTRIVVMSKTATQLLAQTYGVDLAKVDFIPHGIPRIPASAGTVVRGDLGGAGPILLTFGLLSPDKGIENVSRARPEVVSTLPDLKYLVVGATHPHVVASEGESYRRSLVDLAAGLGVSQHVEFVNDFVSLDRLIAYLSATDFYLTPYLNPMQITSGTLAYSLGAGKVVISTPYVYAKEVLADGRGILVGFQDSDAIAQAVLGSWSDGGQREHMGSRAQAYGEQMYWDRVGRLYIDAFGRAVGEAKRLPKRPDAKGWQRLPEIAFDHLVRLTDDTGIIQHATFSVPNRQEGYCTDDNARALILTAMLESIAPLSPAAEALQATYLSFVIDSFNPTTRRFRNFMSYGRGWLEEGGSDDCQGRALWALGTLIGRSRDEEHVHLAEGVFRRGASSLDDSTSPRAWAYAVLGAVEHLETFPDSDVARALLELMGGRLETLFRSHASLAWPWIEHRLAYANARIPQAMILAGRLLGKPELVADGLDSLTWLMDHQVAPSGCFSPVGAAGAGQEDFGMVQFDQQPVEVWSSVSACITASEVADSDRFASLATWTFEWFLGRNVLGLPAADPVTGSCCDGLHERGLNRNRGAESTLAYLCSLTELRHSLRDLAIRGRSHRELP